MSPILHGGFASTVVVVVVVFVVDAVVVVVPAVVDIVVAAAAVVFVVVVAGPPLMAWALQPPALHSSLHCYSASFSPPLFVARISRLSFSTARQGTEAGTF